MAMAMAMAMAIVKLKVIIQINNTIFLQPIHIYYINLMYMGKKIAVLIGNNYTGTQYKLFGCQNDVLKYRLVLQRGLF